MACAKQDEFLHYCSLTANGANGVSLNLAIFRSLRSCDDFYFTRQRSRFRHFQSVVAHPADVNFDRLANQLLRLLKSVGSRHAAGKVWHISAEVVFALLYYDSVLHNGHFSPLTPA